MIAPSHCVNPHCNCPECSCSPCTCNLVQTETHTHTTWSADQQALTHTVETVYRPTAPKSPSAGHGQGHGQGHANPPAAPVLGELKDALTEATDSAHRKEAALAHASHPVHGHNGHTNVRKATYKGHAIEIHTTYGVTIDGKALNAHLEVRDDGSVSYHAVPTYSAPSTIEVMKRVIDSFPDDFPPEEVP